MAWLRGIWWWCWAALVVVVIYPFLHEAGHYLCMRAVGATVLEFRLFPSASVLGEVGMLTRFQQSLVSVAGLCFPLVLVSIARPRHLVCRYLLLVLQLEVWLSFLISFLALCLWTAGVNSSWIVQDDIIKLVGNDQQATIPVLLGMTAVLCGLARRMVNLWKVPSR